MTRAPALFRTAALLTLATLIGLALLLRDTAPDRLPDARTLAALLMAPVAEANPGAPEAPPAPVAAEPARIRAVQEAVRVPEAPDRTFPALPAQRPVAVSDAAPETAMQNDGTGITVAPQTETADSSSPDTPATDPAASQTAPEDLREDPPEDLPEGDAGPVENAGEAEGQRLPVPDLSGLGEADRHAPALAARLVADGAVVLVVELANGERRAMVPGPAGTATGATFVPWGPRSASYSRLQVAFAAATRVLPTDAIGLALRRAGIPDPVAGYALVLTAETERTLLAAQEAAFAETGHDPAALLAAGGSLVTHGCWLAEGNLLRLTAVSVNETRITLADRSGC